MLIAENRNQKIIKLKKITIKERMKSFSKVFYLMNFIIASVRVFHLMHKL